MGHVIDNETGEMVRDKLALFDPEQLADQELIQRSEDFTLTAEDHLNTFLDVEDIHAWNSTVAAFQNRVIASTRTLEASQRVKENFAHLVLHAARVAGRLIREGQASGVLASRGGDRKSKYTDDILNLSDLQISNVQSSQWQQVTHVPEDFYYAYRDECRARGRIPSIAELLRNWTRQDGTERQQEAPALPEGVYNLLYVDPPWRYEHVKTENRAIENHYPTMALQEICDAPIGDLADDDSILFMWATSPKLAEAMTVIAAWGFNYRTCMVWVKHAIGMGYYARQRHELLLIATKGSPGVPEPANRFDSVIEAPRGKHSAKPEIVYDMLETMYPHFTKVELFTRTVKEGWERWGLDNPTNTA
jgi:N6-adenosine-specific RNA methylase IME4